MSEQLATPKPAAEQQVPAEFLSQKPGPQKPGPEKSAPRRELVGIVVGDSMDKTIRVKIDRRVRHPLYGKYLTRSTYLLAHDEENVCHVGDLVMLASSRPLSKRKSWRMKRVVRRAEESPAVSLSSGKGEAS